jgi:hypothetical protein
VLCAGGAFEHPVTEKLACRPPSPTPTQPTTRRLGAELGLSRRRVDSSGTASYAVAPALAVFASLGRTVWGFGDDSTRWLASVGVSVKVKN